MRQAAVFEESAIMAPAPGTIVDVLRQRAALEPERLAYVFLVDGECEEQSLTHAELEARARRIAAALTARDPAGRPVLLVFDPGLEFIAAFFGCLFAGAVAVPVYPPDPRDMTAGCVRMQRIAADAGATTVLTTRNVRDRLEPWCDVVDWLAVDELGVGSEASWQAPALARDQLAFLQYTSGSTGSPKGVMVTHGNIVAHGACVATTLGLRSDAVAVNWLPLYHDMGLIGTVLIPMQVGCHSIQMSPLAFLERPVRWLQAVTRYGGTLSPAPNFAYDLVTRKTSAADRRRLDLGSWTAAMNGAEPIRWETCERFVAAFAACGFRRETLVPCYGLAEATLMVTGGPAGTAPLGVTLDGAALDGGRFVECGLAEPGARVVTSCGAPVPGIEIVVVRAERQTPCGDREVGEVWVAGPSVAAGYWARPEATAEVFGARLADGRGPYLKTGDLGFLHDGALCVTGRADDLIVIRGRNHYPQDLERAATAAHAALRPGGAAAFRVDDDGVAELVVVHEIDSVDPATLEIARLAIRDAVARAHATFVHAVVLIPPRTLPKTSSGKVRRRACRVALLAGELPVLSGWRERRPPPPAADPDLDFELDQWLVRTIADIRGLPCDRVHHDDPLVSLGIDSAEAAQVASELESRLGRPVPLRLLMEQPTIAALAAALRRVGA